MYLVVIAWAYVVLLMAVAEATSPAGSLLGALVTLVLYGVLPLSIVVFILGTPGRRRKLKARDEQERLLWEAQQTAVSPADTAKNASRQDSAAPRLDLALSERQSPAGLRADVEPNAGSHAPGSPHAAAGADEPVSPVRKEP